VTLKFRSLKDSLKTQTYLGKLVKELTSILVNCEKIPHFLEFKAKERRKREEVEMEVIYIVPRSGHIFL
jgi:hypothetical protein